MRRMILLLALLLAFAGPLSATVGYDAFSADDAEGTGNLAWDHVPAGTPKGIIVFIIQNAAGTDQVSGVTYGGTAMTECSGSPNLHASGETAVVYCYFLGSSVPTGTQGVAVTVSSSAVKFGYAISMTAVGNTEIVDSDGTISTDATSDVAVTLSLGGIASFCAVGFHSGENAPSSASPLSGWTDLQADLEHDFGLQIGGTYKYDTIGTADVTAGFTISNDDAVMIAVAVKDTSVPQVGAAPASMGVSPAGTALAAVTPDAAAAVAISCPVCVDVNYPSVTSISLGVSPVVGRVRDVPVSAAAALVIDPQATGVGPEGGAEVGDAPVDLGVSPSAGVLAETTPDAAVSLGVSPVGAVLAETTPDAAVSLGVSPVLIAKADTSGAGPVALGVSPVIEVLAATGGSAPVSLGISPVLTARADTFAAVPVALGLLPAAEATASKPADAPVSLGISPAATLLAETNAASPVSLGVTPALSAIFGQPREATASLAFNVGATAVVGAARKRSVTVIMVPV